MLFTICSKKIYLIMIISVFVLYNFDRNTTGRERFTLIKEENMKVLESFVIKVNGKVKYNKTKIKVIPKGKAKKYLLLRD